MTQNIDDFSLNFILNVKIFKKNIFINLENFYKLTLIQKYDLNSLIEN